MSRTATDPRYRAAFAQRLKTVLTAFDARAAEVSGAMGYRDASTLRAALMGRSNVDPSRLARLSAWCAAHGKPLDLHWLLTGEGTPWRGNPDIAATWLTEERAGAIRLLADGIADLEPIAVSLKTSRRRKLGAAPFAQPQARGRR